MAQEIFDVAHRAGLIRRAPRHYDGGMRLVVGIAVAVVMLTPALSDARHGHHEDAFASEAKQQHAARLAEIQERQEHLERMQERQLKRDIERLSIDDDDDEDADYDDLSADVRSR